MWYRVNTGTLRGHMKGQPCEMMRLQPFLSSVCTIGR